MAKIALTVEYLGTAYHGFQIQNDVPTIQGELEKAIIGTTGKISRIQGAGRTDAGVHAKGQVAVFTTQSGLSPMEFVKALNFYLPKDIAVKDAYEVEDSFDPRRNAVSREYRYTIFNAPTRSPMNKEQSYLVTRNLDVDGMKKASVVYEGKHDFAAFTNQEGNTKNTLRNIYRAEVSTERTFVFFDVEANAFLPQQVRRMTGSLIQIGTKNLQINELEDLLVSAEPGKASKVAPPNGLCLMKVNYS